MRKKIGFTLCSAALCAALLALPGAALRRLPAASVCTPKQVILQDRIKARGHLEPEQVTEVTSFLPVCADRIAVSVGQKVKKGQLLATVDRKTTLSAYGIFLEQAGIDPRQTLSELLGAMQQLPSSLQSMIGAFLQAEQDRLAVLNPKWTAKEAIIRMLALVPDGFYAPADGCIAQVNLSYTSLSPVGSPLFVIGTEEHIIAKLSVPEKDIRSLKKGQQVTLRGAAFSGSRTGHIKDISGTAQTPFSLTGAVPFFTVTVEPEQAFHLPAGCSVTASILLGGKRNALLIPYEAVMQTGSSEFVRLYHKGDFIDALVETGEERPDGVEIVSGLTPDSILLHAFSAELPPFFRLTEELP